MREGVHPEAKRHAVGRAGGAPQGTPKRLNEVAEAMW